jgi:O-antigen/teichoic acid export membrane protein
MAVSHNTVAKNISVMLVAQLITWSLTLTLTIFLPRQLGPDATGKLYFALSVWAIAAVVVKCGMDIYLTTAIARRPERATALLGVSLGLRTALFLLGAAAVAAYVSLLGYGPDIVAVVAIIGVAALLDLWTAGITAMLQGLEQMQLFSLANIANKLVFTGAALLALALGYRLYVIAAVYVLGALVGFGALVVLTWRRHPLRPRLALAESGAMLRSSAPYLMSSVALILYGEVDKQVIAALIDPASVGWYGTAVNLFGTLMFIPVIFTTAIFPSLARLYAAAPDRLPQVARKSVDLMFLVSIPLGLGVMVIARPLVALIYGPAFAPAGAILSLLGVVIIFTYLNILFSQMLISVDRPHLWTIVLVVSTIVTVVLDILLVPWCQQVFGIGALAGAITYLLVEAAQVCAGVLLLPKGTLGWMNVRTAALALAAGLVMAGAVWLTHDLPIVVPVAVGAVVYPGMVLLLRIVPREDFALLYELARQAAARLRPGAAAAPAPQTGDEHVSQTIA